MTETAAAAQLRKEGWCVLREIIPQPQAQQLRIALYGVFGGCGIMAPACFNNVPPGPICLRTSVIKDCPGLAPYMVEPRLLEVLEAAVGRPLAVTSTTFLVHQPDEPAGPWHKGEPFDSTSAPGAGPAAHVMLYWMFSQFTEENGGLLCRPQGCEGTLTITGNVGDVAILDSRIPRAVAANPSPLMRLSVAAGYATAGVGAPPKDTTSKMPKAVYEGMPAAAKLLFHHWVQ